MSHIINNFEKSYDFALVFIFSTKFSIHQDSWFTI